MSTKAYSYIVKLLSSRDYSEYKIREKLKLKEFPAIEIEDALNEIKSRGFLRDTVYNESRIRSLMNKNYSPNYILQKLNQEHLDTNIEQIVDVFNENQVSSLDQIELLIKKRYKEIQNLILMVKIKYFDISYLKVMNLMNLGNV